MRNKKMLFSISTQRRELLSPARGGFNLLRGGAGAVRRRLLSLHF